MPRIFRTDLADMVYHVINRANGRSQIFQSEQDYLSFESILDVACERYSMRLLAYQIMPNHFHLALYPRKDGDLAAFVGWLTMTHTQRWHVAHDTVGTGHLYQGRYKSFIVATDDYFYQLIRYIERNALRANLVRVAEDWQWGSAWRRLHGTSRQQKILADWPVKIPEDYRLFVNEPQNDDEVMMIRQSVGRGQPYGEDAWVQNVVMQHGLASTIRKRGRPIKGS